MITPYPPKQTVFAFAPSRRFEPVGDIMPNPNEKTAYCVKKIYATYLKPQHAGARLRFLL